MFDVGHPICKAYVDPALIRILRGETNLSMGVQNAGTTTPISEGKVQSSSPGIEDRPPAEKSWPLVSLRVDGQWPLRFHGLLICEIKTRTPLFSKSDDAAIVRLVRLYNTEDLRIIAHLKSAIEGSITARPLHRVAYISMRDDLRRLLREGSSFSMGIAMPAPAPNSIHSNPATVACTGLLVH